MVVIHDDAPVIDVDGEHAKVTIGADFGEDKKVEIARDKGGSEVYAWRGADGETTDVFGMEVGETWVSTDGTMSITMTGEGYRFTQLTETGPTVPEGNTNVVLVDNGKWDETGGNIFDLVRPGADSVGGEIVWGDLPTDFGTFTTGADGSWSFTADKDRLLELEQGEMGVQELRYTYRDADGDEVEGTIRLDIMGGIRPYPTPAIGEAPAVGLDEALLPTGSDAGTSDNVQTVFVPIENMDAATLIHLNGANIALNGNATTITSNDGTYRVTASCSDQGVNLSYTLLKAEKNDVDLDESFKSMRLEVVDRNGVTISRDIECVIVDDTPEFKAEYNGYGKIDPSTGNWIKIYESIK